jgi:hypothetical protein
MSLAQLLQCTNHFSRVELWLVRVARVLRLLRYLKWAVDYAGNIRYLDSAQIPQEYTDDFNDGVLTNNIVSFASSHIFSSQIQGSEYGQSLDRFERFEKS